MKALEDQNGWRNIAMNVSVCPFVCPRAYLRNYRSDLPHFLRMLRMAVARSSSGAVAILRVLPVFMRDVIFAHNGQE